MEYTTNSNSQFFSMEDFGKIPLDQGFIGFDCTKDLFLSSKIEDRMITVDQQFIGFERTRDLFMSGKIEDNMMAIEEDKTNDSCSSPDKNIQSPSLGEKTKDNYSKQCLKFCRKISNIIPECLINQNEFFQEVLKFNSGILVGLASALQLDQISSNEITTLQTQCLLRLWSSFKDTMSYSKNKKICIVKQEYWAQIFDKGTSTGALKDIFGKLLGSSEKLAGKQLLKDSTFCEVLARMLFASNKMLILTSILRDSTSKGTYLRNLEMIDNFILLLILPEFFQYYNHRGGKFAIECCGRCKICRSKAIPADFLYRLQTAKQNTNNFISHVNGIFNTYSSNTFDLIVCLMEFAYNQF